MIDLLAVEPEGIKMVDFILIESSTSIKKIGYDSIENILYIQFTSGILYQYFNIPQEVFNELSSTESCGKYFAENIKKIYKYERIGG